MERSAAGLLTAEHAQGRLESALKESLGFDVARRFDDDIEAANFDLHEPERTRRILEIIEEAAGAAAGALVGEILGIRRRIAAGELTVENVQPYLDPALNLAFGNDRALPFVSQLNWLGIEGETF